MSEKEPATAENLLHLHLIKMWIDEHTGGLQTTLGIDQVIHSINPYLNFSLAR